MRSKECNAAHIDVDAIHGKCVTCSKVGVDIEDEPCSGCYHLGRGEECFWEAME